MFLLVSFFVTIGMAAVFVSMVFAIVFGYKKLLQFEDVRQAVVTPSPMPQQYQYTRQSSKEDNIKYQIYRVKKQIELELRDKLGTAAVWEPASSIGFIEQVITAIKSEKSCSVGIVVYQNGNNEEASVNFNIGRFAGITLESEKAAQAYKLSDEMSIDVSGRAAVSASKASAIAVNPVNKAPSKDKGYVQIPIETLMSDEKGSEELKQESDSVTTDELKSEVVAETEDMSEVELEAELPYTFNYEQIASGFLEDNFHEVVDSAVQEALQANEKEFVLTPDELPPEMETWSVICKLLVTKRYGMKHAEIIEEGGILVQI